MLRAVIDANVFYSAFQRDLLWNLVVLRVFQPKWTLEIEAEWTRSLLANRPDLSEDRISRTKLLLRKHGWDWQIVAKPSITSIPELPDAKDQHVLAAAIHATADYIITANIKDFPAALMTDFSVKAVTLDEFLTYIERIKPNDVRQGILTHLETLQPYRISAPEYSALLVKNNLVMFHAKVMDYLRV